MITVISPSKTLDFKGSTTLPEFSQPIHLESVRALAGRLRAMSRNDLKTLMKLSDNLAELNWKRYQSFHLPFTLENAKQALLVFKGDVYRGIETEAYQSGDFAFAQDHLRILSGLYGTIRPLDLIQPYRLEMGTRLAGEWGNSLYDFWGNRLGRSLALDLEHSNGDAALINLASGEYFKAIPSGSFGGEIIDIVFKEKTSAGYRVIGIHAKRARGLMVDAIIRQRIIRVVQLKEVQLEGYQFRKSMSTPTSLVFTRG